MSTPAMVSYQSMGTEWRITLWDDLSSERLTELSQHVIAASQEFDQTYSRFIESSLVRSLAKRTGIIAVPADLVAMLRLYEGLYELSEKKFNPLIGNALSDLGYDERYSLKAQSAIRPVPDFTQALTIIDDTHIELREPALIDIGALGKGYFVDVLTRFLREQSLTRFMVDGSGDVYYNGNEPVRAGLEDPHDPSKAIGVIELANAALCASSSNRRQWGERHHIIDATSLQSPTDVVATWVMADTAAVADALATCLFLTPPERYAHAFSFEYCILNKDYDVKRSAGFTAELFG